MQRKPHILEKLWKEYSILFHIASLIVTITTVIVVNKEKLDAQASQLVEQHSALADHEKRLRMTEITLGRIEGKLDEVHTVVVSQSSNYTRKH